MESLRKWFYKPKRDDRSLLAQFFFADEALNLVAAELDSFDGRKYPERCSTLVNQLRHAQDRVLNITSQIMDQLLGDERVARGFRVKFPEDVLQDNLAGQLWFGAECLAAGSSIMHHELESAAMRPLAKALTRSLETVRALLREHCLRPRPLALSLHDDMLLESLKIFDRLFAEFELCYVSVMVKVKTPQEFEVQQLICVLYSETLQRALKMGLLTQEQVDAYDPALMFAVPRLAIVSGLLIYSSGPLCIDKPPDEMSDMFRPFRSLLHKIRSLLRTLHRAELLALERLLCSNEDIRNVSAMHTADVDNTNCDYPDIGEFVNKFYSDHAQCRDLYATQQSCDSERIITEEDYLPDHIEIVTPIIDGLRRLSEDFLQTQASSSEPSTCTAQSSETSDTTFQNDRLRKCSRGESSELSALRNLSTNGLMMFDPLVINAVSERDLNREKPDHSLVTSLNEQVTEIADRLSSIMTSDTDLQQSQMHSFSATDVPTLIADSQYPPNEFIRNDQVLNMPSTSHGYLIPNAISQEPAVLASLSHNNSAVFNEDEQLTEQNIGQMIVLDSGVDTISFANTNLSSLLLTNEEMRERLTTDQGTSESSSIQSPDNSDKVKFTVGYDSDTQEPTPGDSGVSTENTSLDRSPDSEVSKELREKKSEEGTEVEKEHRSLESSFECRTIGEATGDVTVNINYVDDPVTKNETASSTNCDNAEGSQPRKRKSKVKRKKSRMWSPGNVILENRSSQQYCCPSTLGLEQLVAGAEDDCAADEEIALALQAHELAHRRAVRSKFRSSDDLIHRLFVCIAGVADQLQTNFAADLRNILKSVFLINQTPEKPETPEPAAPEPDGEEHSKGQFEYEAAGVIQNGGSFDSVYSAEEVYADSSDSTNSSESGGKLVRRNTVNGITSRSDVPTTSTEVTVRKKSTEGAGGMQSSVSAGDLPGLTEAHARPERPERAPEWVPDIAAPDCMRCNTHFTAFRRRHHCRNCGKVFCASCSSNSIPLPRYGQPKPVRVCEECFRAVSRPCVRGSPQCRAAPPVTTPTHQYRA